MAARCADPDDVQRGTDRRQKREGEQTHKSQWGRSIFTGTCMFLKVSDAVSGSYHVLQYRLTATHGIETFRLTHWWFSSFHGIC